MKTALLTRTVSSDDGTFGTIVVDSGEEFRSAELPWRDNAPVLSCIPTGVYRCVWRRSPRFGLGYALRDVPNRTNILIHAGNYSGDERLKLRSDTDGCILLGQEMGRLNEQTAVLRSRTAIMFFRKAMSEQPFVLTIR